MFTQTRINPNNIQRKPNLKNIHPTPRPPQNNYKKKKFQIPIFFPLKIKIITPLNKLINRSKKLLIQIKVIKHKNHESQKTKKHKISSKTKNHKSWIINQHQIQLKKLIDKQINSFQYQLNLTSKKEEKIKKYKILWKLNQSTIKNKTLDKNNRIDIYFAYKFWRWRNGDYSGRVRRYRPHVPIVFPLLLTTKPIHNPPSSSSLKRNINSQIRNPRFQNQFPIKP